MLGFVATCLLLVGSPQEDYQVLVLGCDAHTVRLQVRWAPDPYAVVEIAPWEERAAAEGRAPALGGRPPDPDSFEVTLPRFVDGRDRLFSGWVVRTPGGVLAGRAAWAFEPPPSTPERAIVWPASKKGLTCPVDLDDVAALGAAQVAINVQPTHAFLPAEAPDPPAELVLVVEGERLRFDPRWVAALDAEVQGLSQRGAFVVAIVTNAIPPGADSGHPLVHPRCDLAHAPHGLGAFRLSDRTGVAHFVGFLRFLAERYARPDRLHGLVGGYVIGNEIDAHWEWHNMGAATLDEVAEQHARELWLASLTVRSVHPDLRVFTSLTHAWAAPHALVPRHAVAGRDLLQRLCLAQRTRFVDWHVAYHPYPENLFEPRFWNDRSALFALDTPRITLRNIEVLMDALRRLELVTRRRHVLLTEQGFHCGDGERVQAAAYALAWTKLEALDGVDGFLLHRQVDHRGEGGLRLGLWSADPTSADPSRPLAPRLIHEVFRAAGTPAFAQRAAFALPLCGLSSWSEAAPREGPFPEHAAEWHPWMLDTDLGLLLNALCDAEVTDAAALEARELDTPEGRLRGFLLHPRAGGAPARIALSLPGFGGGPRRLRFAVAKLGEGGDGVRFSVRLDGEELWSLEDRSPEPHPIEIALPGLDRPRALVLGVDALGDDAFDQAVWLAPRLVSGG